MITTILAFIAGFYLGALLAALIILKRKPTQRPSLRSYTGGHI
jgi:hypothetical protein